MRLTEKQANVLEYIERYAAERGQWPTYKEMQEALGHSSPNGITQNLRALERKGYIKRGGPCGPELTGKPVRMRRWGAAPVIAE